GTLGFLITPNTADEDYDWQLYDITGHNPNDIFTDKTIIVSGNWSGTYGPTGASASGVNFIQCASNPVTETKPTFAIMPNLIQGHEYILMISHFTDTQSGYSLSFGGGTAVITDPAKPHMLNAKPDCDGKTITLKLNKKISCPSLTFSGSEFSISPTITTVVSATATSCSVGFDFDEVNISLAAALPNGNYQLIINKGSDGNSLLDICGNAIPAGEQVSFQYNAPQPTPADSVGRVSCSSDTVRLYFPKKINCSSIAADGSDFSVSGPTAVTVNRAYGNCINGKTDYIVIKFASPVYTKGNYLLSLKTGTDGTTVIDECGQESPVQTLPFNTADTVSAEFQYSTKFGCQRDTLTFAHDGAHDVNSWNWIFNNNTTITTQTHTIIFPAASTNNIKLTVSNGVCGDSASTVIVLDNEVKASFTMPDFICPEDKLLVTNTSTGQIDAWRWNFDVLAGSTLKDPLPFVLPSNNNRELYLTIKLVAFNSTLGCSDSSRKVLTVLNNCFIAVPSAFTPNNDGLNDYFGPHNAVKALNLDFKVYNRWGQLVFHSHNWREKWDGKINGVLQPTGVYAWMLSYTHSDTNQQVFQKGTVTLIR
ncbi:MAG TPA: gliding motility-associated C-terminal domain-containing protein, partial [Chitinophagaceae bacterium]|nr:gliding motility-associated C-terminal domain-containing protein [Chitinophagaceae bacterium]